MHWTRFLKEAHCKDSIKLPYLIARLIVDLQSPPIAHFLKLCFLCSAGFCLFVCLTVCFQQFIIIPSNVGLACLFTIRQTQWMNGLAPDTQLPNSRKWHLLCYSNYREAYSINEHNLEIHNNLKKMNISKQVISFKYFLLALIDIRKYGHS